MKFARLAVTALLVGALPGAASTASVQQWGPNGNGTLNHEDDLRWLDFHDAKVVANDKTGSYTARFGPNLQKLEGRQIVITGYMMPLAVAVASPHFILTRRSAGCPFCPPNEPTEAIEVFAQKFVQPTQAPITVQGKLHLVANSEQGLFYRLEPAKVW